MGCQDVLGGVGLVVGKWLGGPCPPFHFRMKVCANSSKYSNFDVLFANLFCQMSELSNPDAI